MGGFEAYKFRTVDRPLRNDERKEISSWSSRSSVSSTSATFTYSYGSFPKDPQNVLESYFDAFMYFSGYGERRVIFKIPIHLVDVKALMSYQIDASDEYETHLRVIRRQSVLLIDFTIGLEDGGWLEADGYDLVDFMPLRDAILNGDYSVLYAFWLSLAGVKSAWEEDEDLEDELEEFYEDYDDEEEAERAIKDYLLRKSPPVPAQLQSINGVLSSFMEFFEIDRDLIKAAVALNKGNFETTEPTDYHQLLDELTASEKDKYLKRLLDGEPRLDLQLKKHLDSFSETAKPSVTKFPLEMILEKRKEIILEANRAAQIKAEQKHRLKMKKMEKDEVHHWKAVYKQLDFKQGASYDRATKTLVELKQLAIFKDDLATFKSKFQTIVEQYGRSQALMRRFRKAGL